MSEVKATKLYRILSVMDKSERKQWLAFVAFNLNANHMAISENLVKASGILIENQPDTYDEFGKKLKPKQTKETLINHFWKIADETVKEYVPLIEFRNNRYVSSFYRARFFKYRNLDDLFLDEYEKTQKDIFKPDAIIDYEYYLWLFQFQFELTKYYAAIGAHDVIHDNGLTDALKSLEEFYFSTRFDMSISLKFLNNINNLQVDFSVSESNATSVSNQGQYLLSNYTQLWSELFLYLLNPTIDSYNKLKCRLESIEPHVEGELYKRMIATLSNTVRIVFEDIEDRIKIGLSYFYYDGVEGPLLRFDGKIHPGVFRNVLYYVLAAKDTDLAEEFIEKYQYELIPSYKHAEDVVKLCKAMVAFEKTEYDLADTLCTNLSNDMLLLEFDERRLQIKIDYELGRHIPAEYKSSNFRTHIFRKKEKIGTMVVSILRDFNNMAAKILKTPSFDKDYLNSLKGEIISKRRLLEKAWLIKKIDEKLEGKK